MQMINTVQKKKSVDEPLLYALSALPYRLSDEIRKSGYMGVIEEIRLRQGRRASIVVRGNNIILSTVLDKSEMSTTLTGMCQGSLYAFSETINQGYISLPYGIRVGVCGSASCEGGRIIGVREITSLSIRIPSRIIDAGECICSLLTEFDRIRGVLIYAPPGVGKTTLLRSVAKKLSSGDAPLRTVVIDTRGELSFSNEGQGLCIDVLSGYPRREGVEIATRCLNAEVIICDEIGDYEEAMALVSSHNCGVPLIASAHAASIDELLARTGIRLLHEAGIFGAYVGISRSDGKGFLYQIHRREECNSPFFT